MQTEFQLEIMERLSDIYKEYIPILNDYDEIEMKAKLVEYIIDKYIYKKNWKRDRVYKVTDMNKDAIRQFKNTDIKCETKTLIKFVFGIGCSLEEALILANESNIVITRDSDIARTVLEILKLLEDREFKRKDYEDRIDDATKLYEEKVKQLIKIGKIRNRK